MLQCIEGQSNFVDLNDWRAGEDFNIPLTFTNSDGSPIDLTGAEIYFVLSRFLTSGSPSISLTVNGDDQEDPESGVANIPIPATLSKDLSGDYYYSVKLILDDGNDSKVLVIRGKACLEANTNSQQLGA